MVDERLNTLVEERLRRASGGRVFAPSAGGMRELLVSGLATLPVQLGRYTLRRYLGGGATGRVYEAFDAIADQRVALKVFRGGGFESELLLKREFRALSHISHPNLVTFLEAHVEPVLCYLAMELIEGTELSQYVSGDACRFASGPPTARSDLARLRSALHQLASALAALHAAGMVHRDLKPSNVLVTQGGRLVVLDFGLSRSPESLSMHTTYSGRAVGTPAYMSPEQLHRGVISAASDCYAVGVILFEALVGEVPLSGATSEELARLRTNACAPRPRDLVPDVPSDLDELCHDLLQPDPNARPTSADILERLGISAPRPLPRVVLETEEQELFVGRKAELAELHAALAARSGGCVAVALGGSAGIGKSTLVNRFLQSLPPTEHVVLAAKCHERETLPYKTIDALLDALVPFLKRLPARELEQILPRHMPELVRMFRSLARVPAFAIAARTIPTADEQEQRRRAFAALRELLARIADRCALVLWIDDLQWGDHDSIVVIRQLLCSPQAPECLCIGSFRTEAANFAPSAERFLRPQRGSGGSVAMRTMRLGRLSDEEAEALAGGLMCNAEPAVVQHVARESGGMPFLLAQLAEVSCETQAAPAGHVTLLEVVAIRLARLSSSAIDVVRLVALAASPIEQHVVVIAAQLRDDSVFHELRMARLVRTQGGRERGRVELYHGRLAAPILASLDAESLRIMHTRLARALIERAVNEHERIAVHLRHAGRVLEAADHLLMGAERANAVLAHGRAAQLYLLALRAGLEGTRAQTTRIDRAHALRKAGHSLEAAQAFLQAATAEPRDWQRFELTRWAAQEFLFNGHLEEGRALLEDLLPSVDLTLPKSRLQAVAELVARRAWLRARGLGFRKRGQQEIGPLELARVDTCWLLGQALVMVDPLLGNNLQSHHVLLALRSGEPSRIARALALQAVCACYPGTSARPRVDRLLGVARELSAEVDDPLTSATTTLWGAATAYFMGEPKRALREAEAAERVLREECRGTAFELATCHFIMLGSNNMQGAWRAFGERAQQALDEAVARGNRYQSVGLRVHTQLARLIAGDPEGAQQEIAVVRKEWPDAEFHMQHLAIFFGEARVRLYCGDGLGACLHLESMWPAVQRSMMLRARMLAVEALSWRSRAYALAYAQGFDSRHRRAALRDAAELERQGFFGATGHALTVRGSIAAAHGERQRASELWRSASFSYEREQLPFFAAVADYQAGRYGRGADSQSLVHESQRRILDAGVAEVAPIVQMFTGSPVPGANKGRD